MPTITELIAETIHERAPIDDETAHTIAETITTHPKLTIRARTILDGDPDDIEKALAALPAGSIVTDPDDRYGVFLKAEMVCTSDHAWYKTGFLSPTPSRYLARYHAPLTILR